MTRRLMFTVDLDRDVNQEIEGSIAAGSIDRGQGTSPRFSSSERGLRILLDLLDEIGIEATFFIEGRTSEVIDCSSADGHCIGFHGYDHENLTKMDPKEAMERGFQAVSDNVSKPTCFRAPYMQINEKVYKELETLGIDHDSSTYSTSDPNEYMVGNVVEHPVAKGKDASGKTIAAYLWPMHEGKRSPQDYIDLAHSLDNGDLVLSTHSWHMVESRSDGVMNDDRIRLNVSNTLKVLVGVMDDGFKPSVISRRELWPKSR